MASRRFLMVFALLLPVLFNAPAHGYEEDRQEAARFFKSAQKHEVKGKTAHALRDYFKALIHDPESAHAYRQIGRLLITKNLYADALDHLKQSLFHDPDNAETHYYLGSVYYMAENNAAKSVEHYREFLKRNPGNNKKTARVKEWVQQLSQPGAAQHRMPPKPPAGNPGEVLAQAKALAAAGIKAKAMKYYWKYLELNPRAGDFQDVLEKIAKLE